MFIVKYQDSSNQRPKTHLRTHEKTLAIRAADAISRPGRWVIFSTYKAANWEFDGMTDEGRKTPRCDYMDVKTGKKYSRKSHVPKNAEVIRVHRVSKYRYKLQIRKYA